ncbi:hypothetical protein [Bradyrhizobium ganzhouense]|uniref:hypothetical protein n=1 Tax=Bradyrhizobium ganzhouense TaxID=1179767 RepID=UPI003CE8266E
MDRWAFFLLFICTAAVFSYWRFVRDIPAHRLAIDDFAEQRGLRIISVTRSSNYFRFLFRGVLLSNLARSYRVVVEDIEGNRADIHVAFDVFDHGKLIALEPQGLVLTPVSSKSED